MTLTGWLKYVGGLEPTVQGLLEEMGWDFREKLRELSLGQVEEGYGRWGRRNRREFL